jgi:oligopeptide transport system substrate-binding protein
MQITGMQKCSTCLILIFFVFAGCNPRQLSTRSVRAGGVFKLIYQSSPDTLDPHQLIFRTDWEIASHIYEGLVGYGDTSSSLRPLLAESWGRYEEGRRWIFKLRDNAYFHDNPCFGGGRGRKVSAGDVIYSFERIARIKGLCPNWILFSGKIEGIDEFSNGRSSRISGVRAIDDRRIEIRLTKPYATFLKVLASSAACIVPKEAVDFYGANFGSHPVGTGPFRLVQWKPLDQMLLSRHDRYWRSGPDGSPLPYLDAIEISLRSDANQSVQLAQFLKGETFLFTAEQRLFESIKETILTLQKYRVAGVIPSSAVRFLGFSLDAPSPFARDAELRRAVAMSYDRRELAKLTPQTNVDLANTLVPPLFLDRHFSWYPYDPDAARKIAAVYQRELEEKSPTLASNFQSGDVELLQQDLSRISVKSTVQIRPAEYFQYIVKSRPALFRVSFVPSIFDPEIYYCLFWSKSPRDFNLTGYRNAEFDRTLESAMIQADESRRRELFAHLEEILHRDVPAIYLHHGSPDYLIVSPFVRGFTIRFLQPDFSETWLENQDEKRQQSEP